MQETLVQEDPLEKGLATHPLQYSWASLVAQLVKNLSAMKETWVRFLGWEDALEKGKATHPLQYSWASLVAQLVKNLPAMQETWVPSLGWEDTLEQRKATHSSILAWRIFHGLDSPWSCKESDTTEQLSLFRWFVSPSGG